MTTVAVLGASGELGARVLRLLRRFAPEVELRLASRRGRAARASSSPLPPPLPVRAVDAADRTALRALFEGADLVINCMGPFDHAPGPLIETCIEARCHYVDIAEDGAYIAAVAAAARAGDAAAAGVAVAPGCSTVPGLLHLLAARLRSRFAVTTFDAFLSMASNSPPTRALLTGLLRPLGRPGPHGRWFRELARFRSSDGRLLLCGSTPVALPDGAPLPGARPVPLRFRAGFDRSLLTRALWLLAPVLGRLPRAWLPNIAALLLPLAHAARAFGTSRGVLAVVARDSSGAETARVEVQAPAHGLDVPAAPPLWLVLRLLNEGGLPPGVWRLDQLVRFEQARAWFESAGNKVIER